MSDASNDTYRFGGYPDARELLAAVEQGAIVRSELIDAARDACEQDDIAPARTPPWRRAFVSDKRRSRFCACVGVFALIATGGFLWLAFKGGW